MINYIKFKDRENKLYRIIDYPKKGKLSGNFKAKYPYLAAHKIMNKLNVTDEDKHNQAKFWIREYIKVSDIFIDFIKYLKDRILLLNKQEIKNILIILYIDVLLKHKLINNKNLKKIEIEKHINSFKNLKKNELINLIIILLINFYKNISIKRKENSKKKKNLEQIKKVLEMNLNKLNNNVNKKKNLTNIILFNHKKVKIPKIFEHLVKKIYITHTDNENNENDENDEKIKLHFKRLNKNLCFC